MSEKRFVVVDDGIYDNQEKKHFKFVAYDWIDCDIYECCEMLNEQQDQVSKLQANVEYLIDSKKELIEKIGEQQDTIRELEKNFDDLVEWVSEIAKRNVVLDEQIGQLQRENENLIQKKCLPCELVNLQTKEIDKLKKENGQLRETLHNCRLNKNIISEKLKLWQDVHKEYNIYSIKDFEELMKNVKQKW